MPEVEKWRQIPGFEGYEASDMGRVRSWRCGEGRVLKPFRAGRGYSAVSLCDGRGGSKKRYVHRLVLETFVGPCPEDMEARHVDSNNITDNALSNLAWGTKEQNESDKERHGTRQRGERVFGAVLSEDDVREAKLRLRNGVPQKHVARMLNVHPVTIFDIAHGRTWRHVS